MLVEFPEQPRIGPLAAGLARLVRRAPRPSDRGLVVALIPAHDEQDRIGKAIRSLNEQISKPDLTIVIADGCTDRTALAAQSAGADVFVTVGNEHKRAGALNQVLDLLLPQLRDDDAILIMNADSFLAPTFVSEARRRLTEDVGGVGGVFMGLARRRLRRPAPQHAVRALRPRPGPAARRAARPHRRGDALLGADALERRHGSCSGAAARRGVVRLQQ